MKAIVQDRYGSPDVLQLREVDQPVPAGNEVLVRVHAAALNAFDWHVMRGDPYLARLILGLSGPKAKIRGRDFAGRVEAIGAGVTRFRVGDPVYGAANGTFAEFVCARDDAMEPKPGNLTFVQAAAVPMAGVTALMGLRDQGQVRPGQQVLVNGASGGVGTFAVQVAKSLGAEVTGVCSSRNLNLVRGIGADHLIDYTREDFTSNGRPYDLVFDLVGNRSLEELRRALTPAGTLVLSGGGVSGSGSLVGAMGLMLKGKALSPFVSHRLVVLTATTTRANLVALRELAESGRVTPMIDRTYSLSDVPEAVRYLEEEHARSKVVITI